MPMWKKLGLIFRPDTSLGWMRSHAQLPTVYNIKDSFYRVYYASRNNENISQIGYFEIDINEPRNILFYSKKPILTSGDIGFFDEHGVYPSSVISVGDKIYMYYIGWNRGHKAPLFYASIGLAISEDGGKTFHKYSRSPILSRTEHDPCLVTAPSVYQIDQELGYHMLYTSGFKWEQTDDSGLISHYHIKYAYSNDGINWLRKGRVAIDYNSGNERNIARAQVIKINQNYLASFSYKTMQHPYRLASAKSIDGKTWVRTSFEPGLDSNKSGFDVDMQAYPFLINHRGILYLFYNGNSFGKEGVGLAILEQ